jgi:hypothetical protein
VYKQTKETSVTDKFEIPNTMRDFAETSVEQARKAFDEYLAAAQKAMGGFGTSAASAQESVRSLGEDAISFAEENMAANFDFAKQMVSARTIEDMVKVQSGFIERQITAFTKQGEKLAKTVSEAGKEKKKG